VVKTPSNAYRLRFLQALLPSTEIRVLHLTRSAAASINGLYDGWLHRGFFSHRLEGRPLSIRGYSERFPAWGADWWNFDLPPGWEQVTRSRLEEVCAFQWRSAHAATLEYAAGGPSRAYHAMRFEDVVGPIETRREVFGRLAQWLGVPMDQGLTRVVEEGLPPIMATDQPRHNRWYARAALLGPLLEDASIAELMERLGYDRESYR
jgi:hypothetical protein